VLESKLIFALGSINNDFPHVYLMNTHERNLIMDKVLIIGGDDLLISRDWIDGSSPIHKKVDLVALNTGQLCSFYPLPRDKKH
jgi:hypothetical protein